MRIDLIELGNILATTFPDVGKVAPIERLGDGFSSLVIETAGGIVFRIAKNQKAGGNFEKELRVLPHLRNQLSIAIPNPQWYIAESDGLPFGAIGYAKLAGRPLEMDLVEKTDLPQLADAVAAFLIELHQISLSMEGLPFPSGEIRRKKYEEMWSAVKMPLRDSLSADEFRRIDMWWGNFLSDGRVYEYVPTVIHGDLWYENLLVDESLRRLVGVLDWENVALSDSALDFVPQYYLGDEFAEWVMDGYQGGGGIIDTNFRHRIEQLRVVREFEGLYYAVQYNDAEEFGDAVGKILGGSI